MLLIAFSDLQSQQGTRGSTSSHRKCEKARHESYHEHSTQTGRSVTHDRDNAKPCTHRAVFPLSTDSPLQARHLMLTALRKSGRRLPPSRRPGSVHLMAMTGD
jgi:hypothetical protein